MSGPCSELAADSVPIGNFDRDVKRGSDHGFRSAEQVEDRENDEQAGNGPPE
jgi:hypothetical protein